MKYKTRFFDSNTQEHKASYSTDSLEELKHYISSNINISTNDICAIATDKGVVELPCLVVLGMPSPEQRANIEAKAHQAVLNNAE